MLWVFVWNVVYFMHNANDFIDVMRFVTVFRVNEGMERNAIPVAGQAAKLHPIVSAILRLL